MTTWINSPRPLSKSKHSRRVSPPPAPAPPVATLPLNKGSDTPCRKQSVTFQSHELKFLEESIQRAEALLEERKNRFSQQFPGSSPDGNAPSSSSKKTRPPIPSYDENDKVTETNGAEPKRTAPKPPGTEGYVVVQKTPSIMGAAAGSEEQRRFDEQYKGRPPPPVPAES